MSFVIFTQWIIKHNLTFIKHCSLLIYLGLLSFSFVWIRNFDVWLQNSQYVFRFTFLWRPESLDRASTLFAGELFRHSVIQAPNRWTQVRRHSELDGRCRWQQLISNSQSMFGILNGSPADATLLDSSLPEGGRNPESLIFGSNDELWPAAATDCPWRRLEELFDIFRWSIKNIFQLFTSAIKQEKLQVSIIVQIWWMSKIQLFEINFTPFQKHSTTCLLCWVVDRNYFFCIQSLFQRSVIDLHRRKFSIFCCTELSLCASNLWCIR